jgi:hypothetical protein
MTRYKGRPSAQSIARDFSHVVEIAMPVGGLGKRLDAMHEFHARRGIRARNGPHRRDKERDFISWCFADSQTADTFAAEFCGIPSPLMRSDTRLKPPPTEGDLIEVRGSSRRGDRINRLDVRFP